jgi:hypothetical protein
MQQQNSPQEDGGFTAECQIVCGQTVKKATLTAVQISV